MATSGSNTVLYLGAYNLTPYFNSASADNGVKDLDATVFGATQEISAPGLGKGSVKASGFFDGAVGAVQEALDLYLGSSAGEPGTLGLVGDTVGNRATLWLNELANGNAKSAVGGLITTDAECLANGGLGYGVWLAPLAARTTTANGTSVDGAAATTTGWRATLHCTAASGTTPTLDVKLQDSADNVTFADVTTFGTLSAAGSEYRASASGATLRRYVRIIWTLTGTSPSFTFAAAVARTK